MMNLLFISYVALGLFLACLHNCTNLGESLRILHNLAKILKVPAKILEVPAKILKVSVKILEALLGCCLASSRGCEFLEELWKDLEDLCKIVQDP